MTTCVFGVPVPTRALLSTSTITPSPRIPFPAQAGDESATDDGDESYEPTYNARASSSRGGAPGAGSGHRTGGGGGGGGARPSAGAGAGRRAGDAFGMGSGAFGDAGGFSSRGGGAASSALDAGGFSAAAETEDLTPYCVCQRPQFGEMVACDTPDCPHGEWFHLSCVNLTAPPKGGSWFCPPCRASNAAAAATKSHKSSHRR